MQSAHIPGTPNYDESKKLLEIFCKYFVELYELKLDAYIMFIEGKSEKAGKFAEFCSEKIGQGAGAGLAYFFPTFSTGVKLANLGAKLIGKTIEKKIHDEKVKSVLHLIECWRNDKPGFRVKLAAAAVDLGQSFEMQFMFITFRVGGYREALRRVALDSVNRSFNCYENIERSIEQMTISESVLRGSSKIETILGMQIDVEFIKTPGFTIYYRNENDEWHTSSLFDKSGVVIDTANSMTYYKLKINSRTSKYGYRKLLKCEVTKWSKLFEKYEEESHLSDAAHFTDYNYKFSVGSDEFSKIENDLLNHVNEKDPKLLEKRMKKLLTEIQESILHDMQTLIDAQKIDHNLLVDMKEYLTEFNSVILNNSVEMLQLQKQLLEVTNKNQQETVGSFNLASRERQEFADANTSQHEETQRLVVEYFNQQKNTSSKPSRSFEYKVRDCNLNYIKRYNANDISRTEEINNHFYPVNDSKNPIPIVIISGLGGVGKSEEGRKYCKYWWDGHEGIDRAVLWIDCTTMTSFIDIFKSLGFELKIWTKSVDVPKTEKNIVKAIYSHFLDRETLFVFDDADEDVQKFLPQSVSLLLHEGQKLPYILMTSRTKSWDGAYEGFAKFQLVELGVFTEQEGLNYVKGCFDKFQGEIPNDKDILDLSKLLHSLPLALRQAVAYIQAERASVGQYSIVEYIDEYKVNGKKLLSFSPYKNDDERYSNPVLTTWLITLEKIKNKTGGQEACDVLNILAYLFPNAIELHKILGVSVTDTAIKDRTKKDRDLKSGIQLLSKYSLIDLDSDRRAYIHAFVQEVIRIQLKKVSMIWQGALCLLFLSFLFIITNAIFSFGSELSKQMALAFIFISFPYVVSTSYNAEERTLGKVLKLLSSAKVSRDEDTTNHANEAWCHATNYFKLVYKHFFVINNFYPLNVSIRRYGPLQNTPLHLLSHFHSGSAYNLLWYISFVGKFPKFKELVIVNSTNNARDTPLHMACKAHSSDNVRMVEFLLNQGSNIKANNVRKSTPLHHAAELINVDIAEILIKQGANIEAEDEYGSTPLICAVLTHKVEMTKFLIKQGANIEAKDLFRCTPLLWAALWGKKDFERKYLKKNIGAADKDKNPLSFAVDSNKEDLPEVLIKLGANIKAKDGLGRTVLHFAAISNKIDNAKLFIKHGAYIEAKNLKGYTPLHSAVLKGNLDIAEFLIKQGANIETEDVNGNTPLHSAVEKSFLKMTKMLCKRRANVFAKNSNSPLQIAVSHNNLDIIHTLLKSENTNINDITLPAFDNDDSCLTIIFLLAAGVNIGSIRQSKEEKTRLLNFIVGNLDSITEKLISIAGQDIEHKIPLIKQLLESDNGEENVTMLE